MKKISCHEKSGIIYADFTDYKDRHQLKDFYKLFKKSSGFTVIEYAETDGKISAITDNKINSLKFAWFENQGCCVYSDKTDVKELIKTVFYMLCYRYSPYSQYAAMLEDVINVKSFIKENNLKNKSYNGNEDDGIIEDMNELKSQLNSNKT